MTFKKILYSEENVMEMHEMLSAGYTREQIRAKFGGRAVSINAILGGRARPKLYKEFHGHAPTKVKATGIKDDKLIQLFGLRFIGIANGRGGSKRLGIEEVAELAGLTPGQARHLLNYSSGQYWRIEPKLFDYYKKLKASHAKEVS